MNIRKQIRFGFVTLIVISLLFVNAANVAAQGGEAGESGEPGRVCVVSFQGVTLSVDSNFKYIEAEYTFDKNCRPVLVATRRGDNLPETDQPQQAVESFTTTVKADPFSLSEPFGDSTAQAAAVAATNTCHTETWETDLAYARLIEVQNDTVWTWNGSTVTYWSVTATAHQYFTWWYRYNGPNASWSWNPYPTKIRGKADASFYCNGGPFCSGGPMYYMTLQAWTNVDKSGICSGYGVYSGTVVPGGHVLYRTWKD